MRFDASDRALLAALLHSLPRDVLHRVRLLVRPDTVLRWHRDLLARGHAAVSRPKRSGRPRTVHSVRTLVLRLARENPGWGSRRRHGELLVLGVKVAASTVWEILQDAGIDPAPERASSTWADFLRSQADALLACDFFETVTLTGARMYVFAVIEHASRRIHILGATEHPSTAWVVQAAKNLVMDLEDTGSRARYLIRDRDGKFGTTAVIKVWDAETEEYVIKVAVESTAVKSMPAGWEEEIRKVYGPDIAIEFVMNPGTSRNPDHAEETILGSLGDTQVVVEGGASRNVCLYRCNAELPVDINMGGRTWDFRGEKTPFRAFWRGAPDPYGFDGQPIGGGDWGMTP